QRPGVRPSCERRVVLDSVGIAAPPPRAIRWRKRSAPLARPRLLETNDGEQGHSQAEGTCIRGGANHGRICWREAGVRVELRGRALALVKVDDELDRIGAEAR